MLELTQLEPAQVPAHETDPAYAQFRDQTRFWIQRVAVPVLTVIGLFGNTVTVIIMTRRGMRSTTNLYLAALAFVDMLYLVLTFLLGLSHYPDMAGRNYYFYWRLRPFLMMLTDACSNTSVWLTVTFTIERYIAVKYPMKGKVWCTEARAKMLIVLVFFLGILFAAPVPFEWQVVEKWPSSLELVSNHSLSSSQQANELANKKEAFVLALDYSDFGRNETYKTIYYWSTAVIFYFIPLFSLMLFNGFLIRSVHKSRKERTKMTARTSAPTIQCPSNRIFNIGTQGASVSSNTEESSRTNSLEPAGLSQKNAPANSGLIMNCAAGLHNTVGKSQANHKPSDLESLKTGTPAANQAIQSANLIRPLAGNESSCFQATTVPASTHERRITIMLIAVVILFLVCQIPSAAMLLYTSVREIAPNTNEHALVLAFGNIFNFLMAVNAAGDFILYSLLSEKYRKTFVILFFSCLCSQREPSYSQLSKLAIIRSKQADQRYRTSLH